MSYVVVNYYFIISLLWEEKDPPAQAQSLGPPALVFNLCA